MDVYILFWGQLSLLLTLVHCVQNVLKSAIFWVNLEISLWYELIWVCCVINQMIIMCILIDYGIWEEFMYLCCLLFEV
jgi:hypothetical protein